jgi:hypothetical protein
MSKADVSTTPIRSRRAVLAGIASAAALPIAAAVPTIAPAEASQAIDPIFGAIEAWRRADDAVIAVPYGVDIPDELGDQCDEAYLAVVRTRPVTPAGLAALTTWVRERTDWLCANSSHLPGEELCAIAAAIDDATRGMSGLEPWSPPPAAALIGRHPDAPLLLLAEEHAVASKEYDRLEAIWLELDNRRCHEGKEPRGYKAVAARRARLGKVCEKLEEGIISMPAHTFEGVTAKARTLSANLVDDETVEGGLDARYAASMARDLLAIAGEASLTIHASLAGADRSGRATGNGWGLTVAGWQHRAGQASTRNHS